MTFEEKYQCLDRLERWLKSGRAQGAAELARAFAVSPRTIKRWLAHLRQNQDLNITYCRRENKYRILETWEPPPG